MKVKEKRQAQILKLVSTSEVETQEEITLFLRNLGFKVTQATVSRDIKDLNLIKTAGTQKRYKYMASDQVLNGEEDPRDHFSNLFRNGVLAVNTATQFLVLRCRPGLAQAIAALIDSKEHPGILGSVAGDDTIFIATESAETADLMCADFRKVIG